MGRCEKIPQQAVFTSCCTPAAGGTPSGGPLSVPTESGERMGKGLSPFRPLTRVGYSLRRRSPARSAAAIRFPPESDRAQSAVPRANRQGVCSVAAFRCAFCRSCCGYVNLHTRLRHHSRNEQTNAVPARRQAVSAGQDRGWNHIRTATFWRKVG